MQLLGGPAVTAKAATQLPSADLISPPRALVLLALGAAELAAMPRLKAVLDGRTTAAVSHDPEGTHPTPKSRPLSPANFPGPLLISR